MEASTRGTPDHQERTVVIVESVEIVAPHPRNSAAAEVVVVALIAEEAVVVVEGPATGSPKTRKRLRRSSTSS